MTEDQSLNCWLKNKLEADRPFEFRPIARWQAHWRWVASALCAASIAMVLAFRMLVDNPRSRADDGIVAAIGFLSVVDGFDDTDLTTGSVADRLLAWQEAPLAESLQAATSVDFEFAEE